MQLASAEHGAAASGNGAIGCGLIGNDKSACNPPATRPKTNSLDTRCVPKGSVNLASTLDLCAERVLAGRHVPSADP